MPETAETSNCGECGANSGQTSENLLVSKFFIPPLRADHIPRLHLIELLEASRGQRLVLVSAPAGYGKTTLVAAWLAQSRRPAVWLSLDEADNDPNRFLLYLIDAFRRNLPGLTNLPSPVPLGAIPSQVQSSWNDILRFLGESRRDFILVLDDYHLIQSPAVHAHVGSLCENLPPGINMVMISRSDPPLPLARMRARGELLEIRTRHLRFSAEEEGSFLKDRNGFPLTPAEIEAMDRRTEGWIAGLHLAALSMRNHADLHAFVAEFTGSHQYIMDYLVEEVLKNQPEDLTRFLLLTSNLERLEASLCQAVLENELSVNCQEMLERLDRQNMFLIPLDDQRKWSRYHHLFAEVLRRRLEFQRPGLSRTIHRKASVWFETHDQAVGAIRHAMAAGESERAVRLIEEHGCVLMINGEVATLEKWLSDLEYNSQEHPWLAVQQAWALALGGELERSEHLLKIPEKTVAALDLTEDIRTIRGTIAAAHAFNANARGDTAKALRLARAALKLLPDSSLLPLSIRSVANSIQGDASWIEGRLDEAADSYREAARIGRLSGQPGMVIIAGGNLAETLLFQGKLRSARQVFEETLNRIPTSDGQSSPLASRLHLGLARCGYLAGDLEKAGSNLKACFDICRRWNDREISTFALALRARLEYASGCPDDSRITSNEAVHTIEAMPLFNSNSANAVYDLGRAWLALDCPEKASALLKKRGLTDAMDITLQRAPEFLILLRLHIAQSNWPAARALSTRLLKLLESGDGQIWVVEALLLNAVLCWKEGDSQASCTALEKAVLLARDEHPVQVFRDEWRNLHDLTADLKHSLAGTNCLSTLQSMLPTSPSSGTRLESPLIEPLTDRELEVLQLIENGLSNQEIAARLVISVATVKRHISTIYAKLGVKTRTQAVSAGRQFALFEKM